jgi:ATP-binding cassette subfamily F protein 3
MLLVSGIAKSYGSQVLFEDVSFTVNPGERVGLVGRNGHGKSTLFKILLGLEEADQGSISVPQDYKTGYLSQHLVFTEKSILDEVCLALPLLDGSWKETYKAEALLHGLGFHDEDFARAPSEFSGGYQIRLNLVKLLLSEPNLLLLDEPTNYLDIVSVRWLGRFLRDFAGEVLIITHDRAFMDSVTTHTVGIHRGKVRKVEGSTEKLYTLLAEEEEIYEKTRLGEEKKRKQVEAYVNRFRAKASKAKSVQSKVKLLEKMEQKDELIDVKELEFNFTSTPFPGKWPLVVNEAAFAYTPEVPLIPPVSFSLGKNDRIAVIGPNGKGKTTFLNLLAKEIEPVSGEVSLNDNTALAYFGQTNISRLDDKNNIEDEVWSVNPILSRTVIRSVCGAMMFEGDSALKNVSVLSGGEKSRVLLAKILLTPCNLLLLDEPTNHLDMYSVEALVEAIEDFDGAVAFVTHSEDLIQRLANRLIIFDRGTVEVFEGSYEDFLRLKGWQDEDDDPALSKAKDTSGKQSRENEKKLKKLEAKIEKQEKKIADLHAKLEEASRQQNLDKLLSLNEEQKAAQRELEKLYDKL